MEVRVITHSREASTKVHVFMSTQPVFIHLVHRPTSGMLRGKSCMSGYSYIQPVGSAVTQLSL